MSCYNDNHLLLLDPLARFMDPQRSPANNWPTDRSNNKPLTSDASIRFSLPNNADGLRGQHAVSDAKTGKGPSLALAHKTYGGWRGAETKGRKKGKQLGIAVDMLAAP